MNIHINSFLSFAISSFKEQVLLALTAQQKKIIVIASIVFGCLAALVAVRRCCFKAKPSNENDLLNDKGKEIAKEALYAQPTSEVDDILPLDDVKFPGFLANNDGSQIDLWKQIKNFLEAQPRAK